MVLAQNCCIPIWILDECRGQYHTVEENCRQLLTLGCTNVNTGPLNSPFSLEVLGFKSTTKETREKDWPDLQIHFIEIMPNDILMDIFNYAEEVSSITLSYH